ncbi:hypothetical protein SK128_022653 [Halocaridina rubra]|uniref:Uncharacterized protein n=1 Tax=Halocaridina rubra TaxID=373956 RepID=A0AAN8ZV95_HALRR
MMLQIVKYLTTMKITISSVTFWVEEEEASDYPAVKENRLHVIPGDRLSWARYGFGSGGIVVTPHPKESKTGDVESKDRNSGDCGAMRLA